MKNPYELRCYAKPEGDHFVGMCVDLNIAVTGSTIKEVKSNMNEAITGYLQCITPENFKDLIPRPAPLRIKIEYHCVILICQLRIFHHWCIDKIQAFTEICPPSNPCIEGLCA